MTRCAELSEAAGESLAATAPTVAGWLLLEVPGSWPRDVSGGAGLSDGVRARIGSWLDGDPGRRRLLYVRRPDRTRSTTCAFVVRAEADVAGVRRLELAAPGELADVDFETAGSPVAGALVLVCGHGSRDACCALRGTAVFAALEPHLGPEELWISSHHGGHRFAANVLVLPHALHFGRVDPGEAPALVARALAGRIALDRYRGRTCYEPAVQAAEHVVRTSSGVDRVDLLRLSTLERGTVTFRDGEGRAYRVVVEERDGPSVPASCGARPESQRRLVARLL